MRAHRYSGALTKSPARFWQVAAQGQGMRAARLVPGSAFGPWVKGFLLESGWGDAGLQGWRRNIYPRDSGQNIIPEFESGGDGCPKSPRLRIAHGASRLLIQVLFWGGGDTGGLLRSCKGRAMLWSTRAKPCLHVWELLALLREGQSGKSCRSHPLLQDSPCFASPGAMRLRRGDRA